MNMRKHLSAILVLSVLLFNAGCKEKTLTFVHMSDTQVGFIDTSAHFVHSDSLFAAAVQAVNALSPACVVITGDLVDSASDAEQNEIFEKRTGEIEAPVYLVPGNHDIRGYTPEKYEEYVAKRGYGRFSFYLGGKKGTAFIGIDSNCIKDGCEEAENEQLEWLEAELSKARGARHILVFLHCPIIRESIDEKEDYFNFPLPKRESYIRMFKDAGVEAVFAGHTHRTVVTEYDGIKFFTAGPVGNALGDGTPGFNVVTVGPGGVAAEYVPTPGIDPSHCRF